MVMMAWFGTGFNFGFSDLLSQLESMGFFAYILPFLLIFAVVYAILVNIKIFSDNKGPAAIIAAATGLLALQLGYVSTFFQIIFPKLGMGIAVLLVALILAGAFLMNEDKGKQAFAWIFFGLGALIWLVVIISSLQDWSFVGGYWWDRYGALAIMVLIIAAAVVAIIVGGKKRTG